MHLAKHFKKNFFCKSYFFKKIKIGKTSFWSSFFLKWITFHLFSHMTFCLLDNFLTKEIQVWVLEFHNSFFFTFFHLKTSYNSFATLKYFIITLKQTNKKSFIDLNIIFSAATVSSLNSFKKMNSLILI